MANYGIIDCGSNTVRLCIYQVRSGAVRPYRKKDLKILLNHKTMAGLAAHVAHGTMTERGVARAAEVIGDHLRRAEYFKCKQLDIFATAFLRNCRNSAEAQAAIESAVKHPIHVLSAWDEAHLGYVGVTCADASIRNGVLIDIGGGSTELTRIMDGEDHDNISIPQGSLSSFSDCVLGITPTAREMDVIASDFRRKIEAEGHYRQAHCKVLYGIGGSVRGAAKLYGEVFRDGKRPDTLSPDQMQTLLALYRREPETFAHMALKAVPDRIHTVIPGCIIIDELLRDFQAPQLHICKGGVREGYLIDRMLP